MTSYSSGYQTPQQIKQFFNRYGLKKKFVAQQCGIEETRFSSFLNGSWKLKDGQMARLSEYVEDYIRRNDTAVQ